LSLTHLSKMRCLHKLSWSELKWNLFDVRNISFQSQSQNQSYFTTDGQSASLSWSQATIWDPRPISLSVPWKVYPNFRIFMGFLYDKRMGLPFRDHLLNSIPIWPSLREPRRKHRLLFFYCFKCDLLPSNGRSTVASIVVVVRYWVNMSKYIGEFLYIIRQYRIIGSIFCFGCNNILYFILSLSISCSLVNVSSVKRTTRQKKYRICFINWAQHKNILCNLNLRIFLAWWIQDCMKLELHC
jgi:hypothetical protein